jgi:uncharacterized HhH-GPD family protein
MGPASSGSPSLLPFSGIPEADALLAADPMALLIGFVLDQQVPLEWAFSSPLELRRRIGTLDPVRIAEMDPQALEAAFRQRPMLHRFPGAMARRVQELAAVLVRDYGGDPTRIWHEAGSGEELHRRLRALPGIGEMKAGTLVAVLAKRLGVRPAGWEAVVPDHPTLGDVDSDEARRAYQAFKRARKAELRAGADKVGGG